MSWISEGLRNAGKAIDKGTEDILDELERSPKFVESLAQKAGLLGRGGFSEMDPTRIWRNRGDRGRGRSPRRPQLPPPPTQYDPGPQYQDLLDALEEGDLSPCKAAGAKPWTITSTVVVAAGALAADTDIGATTNPFANANSAFFTTAGVFPQPFLSYGIGGMISGTQPIAATENPSRLDSIYVSMRASTELARYSTTRDLGYGISKEGFTGAAAGTGVNMISPLPYRSWRQFFDPRTTYVWGYRLPRAVTTVAAVEITLILHGLLFEGGARGSH